MASADMTKELNRVETRFKYCLGRANSDGDMRACTYDAYGAADELLQRNYDHIVARLKSPGETGLRDPLDGERLSRLVAAERAWITFRDAECVLAGAYSIGGTMESLDRGSCLYDQTVCRVKDLDRLFSHMF